MRVFGFSVPIVVVLVIVYIIGARYPAIAKKVGVA